MKLTLRNDGNTRKHTYDTIGRRTSMSVNGLPPVTYDYDENSNLISDGTTTYTWDARNRLTSMSSSTEK